MIATAERQVRKLRLRAADDALVRRGATLVEDALRVASIPEADGAAVLFIRYLALGRIRPGDSSATLALRIEDQVRRLAARAVHASHPSAAASPVVYFRDAFEAPVLLAVEIASGREAAAWFWPRAVAGWRVGLPATTGLRGVLAAMIAKGAAEGGAVGARLAAAQLVSALVSAGRIDALAEVLREPDGPALLASMQWSRQEIAVRPLLPAETREIELVSIPAAWSAALRKWAAQWGGSDARALWLAGVLAVAARPGLASHPSALRVAAGRLAIALYVASESIREHPRITPGPAPSAAPRVGPPARIEPHPDALAIPAGLPREEPRAGEEPRTGASIGEASTQGAGIELPLPTSCAGLYFILAILLRTGFPAWLNEHPDVVPAGFVAALLREIARRTGTPSRDAAVLALGEPEPLPVETRAELAAWLRALRRWSRLEARMGLYNIVRREGRITATRTHIDIRFRLEQADIRVRKAGLDIDPGWLPWFAKVVRFHYLNGYPNGYLNG
jgi:hypothetical protein